MDSLLLPTHLPQANLLRGVAALHSGRLEEAQSRFASCDPEGGPLSVKGKSLFLVTDSLIQFKDKSAVTAALLGIVPGVGHFYTGRKGDGLFSATIIAMFGGITAYYAYHGAEGRTIAFASITGLFYAGSIYGAAVSARLHNTEKRAYYLKRADTLYRGR